MASIKSVDSKSSEKNTKQKGSKPVFAFMKIVAPGAVSVLQLGQNLFPAFGGVPQATHITAFSETSFPQFLQYIT